MILGCVPGTVGYAGIHLPVFSDMFFMLYLYYMRYLSSQNLKKFEEKICLLRVDLNVEPGAPLDSYRLEAVLPTIRLLLKSGIKVVVLSHRGRPHSIDKKLSLKPFAPVLSKKIKKSVIFINNFNFGKIKKQIENSRQQVFLLENLRFLPGEEKNDAKLAKKLASLGDFYVNDAFAVSHRQDASVVAITKYLPSSAGLLLEREIEHLSRVMKNLRHPVALIIGGAKISDKIGVIKHFWNKADYLLLGGGPANTFFAAQGLPVGDSLVDRTSDVLNDVHNIKSKIVLPSDVKIKNKQILDIGERTIGEYSKIIKKSRTVIWNGPMGLFEKRGFEKGTLGMWKAILANKRAQIVVGGGETLASLSLLKTHYSLPKNVFLSTGGGAMLAYLAGKKLPGIESLGE